MRTGAKLGITAAGISEFLKTAAVLRQAHEDVKENKRKN
jgi:hypothetical protein